MEPKNRYKTAIYRKTRNAATGEGGAGKGHVSHK